jgi:AraC-like DNA-binding protein
MRPGSPDRIVVETADVCVGEFRCPVDHPVFRDSGPSSHDCFAFPRSAVVIRHGRGRIVADPNVATLYNRGQEYEREPLSPRGDFCEWFGVSPRLLRQAVAAIDPRSSDAAAPIRFTHAPVTAETYLMQRRLYVRALSGARDPLEIEESVVALLDRVLSAAAATERTLANAARRQRDLVHDTRCVLARDLASPLALGDIADAVGASMFHLCRCFRLLTGRSLHNYRTELRLRHGLEALEDGERDLTRVALDHGFSSHSHFTAAFRHAFGDPPSRVRAALQTTDEHR